MLDIPKQLVLRKIYQELYIENKVSIIKKNAKTIKCIIENDNEILWTSRSGIEYNFRRCLLRIIYSHHTKYIDKENRVSLHGLAVELNYVSPDTNYYKKNKVDTFFKDTVANILVDPIFMTLDISSDIKTFINKNTDILEDKHIIKSIEGTTPNVSIKNGKIEVENAVKYKQKLTSIEDIQTTLEIIKYRLTFFEKNIDVRFGQAIEQSIEQINLLTLKGDNVDSVVSGIVEYLLQYCEMFKPGGIHSTGTEKIINLYDSTRNKISNVKSVVETTLKITIKNQMGPLITKFIASEKRKEASKQLKKQMKDAIYKFLTNEASLEDLLTLVRDEDGDVIDNKGCKPGNKGSGGLLCYREMFF